MFRKLSTRPYKFPFNPRISMASSFKKTKVELELLANIGMLLMVEKGIRGGICHSVNRYAKVNNKYVKDYDKNKEVSYLKYWDVNNLYERAVSQKLSVNGFKWVEHLSEFDECFIKSCNEKSKEGCFLEVDIQNPEELHELHNDLPLLPERMKIGKVEELVTNLHDNNEYVIYRRKLKQALRHGRVLKKVHVVINFNKKVWLKLYIEINTDLKKEAKKKYWKIFFQVDE